MRKFVTFLGAVALVAVGYLLGASQVFSPAASLAAQRGGARAGGAAPSGPELSDETKEKVRAAYLALKSASDALVDEQRYRPAIKGVNTFAVLTGGGNALQDLESGAIVDPETFAGLYAGLAVDSIAAELSRDADDRLTYKNNVVRMYPLSILRQRYAIRSEITGEDLLPEMAEPTAKGAKKKAAPKKKATEDALDDSNQ